LFYCTFARKAVGTIFLFYNLVAADPSGWAVSSEGLRPIACSKCGVRIQPGAWMSVSCECCVLSGCQIEVNVRGRSLVQRSPTDWCVIVCDLRTSRMKRPWPALGCCANERTCRHIRRCCFAKPVTNFVFIQ
jgi:hypothetical protein